MRLLAIAVVALSLAACSRTEQNRAREDARDTANQMKIDGREALHDGVKAAKQASRKIDSGLRDARRDIRGAIDAPPDNGSR